jgi:hypothetical protein
MKNIPFFRNRDAVSEVIGAILLVVIAVAAFAIIYSQVYPVKLPSPEPHVQLAGYVAYNGTVVLEHIGGEELKNYKVLVEQSDGSHKSIYKTTPWQIGGRYYLNNSLVNYSLFSTTKQVSVTVIDIMQDGSTQVVFEGIITPNNHAPGPTVPPPTDPMFLSTLRTNTVDEDLICYSNTIHPSIIPKTFIYKWMVNDVPFTRLLLPFDTNSPFQVKDYSGNNNNGTINGATWTNGKLGGAYRFAGSASIPIPYCFSVNKIDTVTVEVWIKTNQSSGVILSYNRSNYIELGISNGKVKWSTNASDGTADVNGTIQVNDNNWHLIAVTYNATSGTGSIYVDGKLDTSQQAHRANKLLGSGNSPSGAIGIQTGVPARQTIFSTDFETREEANNWNEDGSTVSNVKCAVDSNTSNVDGSADIGTETNFPNAKGTTRDGNVMTIKEMNKGTGTSTLGKTSGTGTSFTTVNGNTMYGQNFTAASSGEIYQATFYGRSSSGSINTKMIICDSTGIILPNGISNAVSVSTTAGNKVATWTAGARPIVQSGQTYWIMVIPSSNSIRLYYDGTTGGTSKADTTNSYTSPTNPTDATTGTTNYRVLYADINNINYQIDFEYQWTTATYKMINKQVCLYVTSHTGSENLLVNYRNGSTWTLLGTITSSGWFNVTATGLSSSTYTIQLKGASDSSDSSQDTWNIDAIFLHVWTTQRTFDMLPSTALTPHAGLFSLGGSGDFYPMYTFFNRTDINLYGYQNVKLTVWYSYKNTESNDFFGLYYKNNSQWNPIFEITNPTQSGQKEWTQVIVSIPHTLNTLRLQFKWRTTASNEYVAIDDLKITGVPLMVENNFTGIIDEVKIYPRELTPEQLYQDYLCTNNSNSTRSVIVSEETVLNEQWQCFVMPNDATRDDVFTPSNQLTVIFYIGGG